MNYDKLSRSLRYYYEKGIMQKVTRTTHFLFGVMSIILALIPRDGVLHHVLSVLASNSSPQE